MTQHGPNAFNHCIVRFFQEYLPVLRGLSVHTIRSYWDALVLYLRFVAAHRQRPIERLDFEDLTAAEVGHFLAALEETRGSSVTTRNVRLAALHTFARFAIGEHPEWMTELQRILAIPFKRGARREPVEYLEEAEVEALLTLSPEASAAERRDHALFALMFNTGARVQEVLDLTVGDVRLETPYQVRLCGKGGKIRCCPIWASMAKRLRELIEQKPKPVEPDSPLFHQPTREQADAFWRAVSAEQEDCSLCRGSPHAGGETDPSALAAPHDRNPSAEIRRRVRHR